jgi:magnesium transporter
MPAKLTPEDLGARITDYVHTNMVALRQEQTAREALHALRRQDISDKIIYLYVVDEQDTLVGVVPVRRLLTAEPDATVQSLMVGPVVSIPGSLSVLEACEVFLKQRLLALPVVDHEGRLLGVVDLTLFTDEVLTAAQQQTDSAFQLIGVHVALGRRVSSWTSFKDRFPWLLCNMASGIACAFIAGRFELLLSQVVLLAMFLTVVLALGESVSIQSMTITLQGLMGLRTDRRHLLRSIRKEFTTSALLGLSCGLVVGLTALAWRGAPLPALAIGGGIFMSIITACLLGVAIPTAVHVMRIDPKVAAGPIVLASADVATLLFYFGIAQRLLM